MNSKTNKLASFSCVVATIAKCNILKSVLGLHKLASTAKQTMFEIHKLASNRQRVFGLARGSGSCGGDNGPPDNGGHSGLCPLLSTCVQGVDSHPKPPGLQLQPSLPPESGSGCTKHNAHRTLHMFWYGHIVGAMWCEDILEIKCTCGQNVVLCVSRQQIYWNININLDVDIFILICQN